MQGAHVVLVDRDTERGAQVASLLRKAYPRLYARSRSWRECDGDGRYGGVAEFVQCDVSDEAAVQAMVQRAAASTCGFTIAVRLAR